MDAVDARLDQKLITSFSGFAFSSIGPGQILLPVVSGVVCSTQLYTCTEQEIPVNRRSYYPSTVIRSTSNHSSLFTDTEHNIVSS